jgi:hypothetical protein
MSSARKQEKQIWCTDNGNDQTGWYLEGCKERSTDRVANQYDASTDKGS